MISIFGIASISVAVASVVFIMLHNRVINKRAPVDAGFAALEDLLRGRIEALLSTSEPGSGIHQLCGDVVDMELHEMIKALPEIDRAVELELHIDDDGNMAEIYEAIVALNLVVEEYNRYITGSLPVVFMAQILGITTEEQM